MAFRTHIAFNFVKKSLSMKYLQRAGWKVILSEDEGDIEKSSKRIPFSKGDDGLWYIRGNRLKKKETLTRATTTMNGKWQVTPADLISPDNESKDLSNKLDIDDVHD